MTDELSTTKNMTFHNPLTLTGPLYRPRPLMPPQQTLVVQSRDTTSMTTITVKVMELRLLCSTAPISLTPSCSTIPSSPLESHSHSLPHHRQLALVISPLLFTLRPCVRYPTVRWLPDYLPQMGYHPPDRTAPPWPSPYHQTHVPIPNTPLILLLLQPRLTLSIQSSPQTLHNHRKRYV